MVEMSADCGLVAIKPLELNGLDGIVELYNCSDGYRYATGVSFPVTQKDIRLKLERLETSKNEFFYGIFLNSANAVLQLIGVVSGIIHEQTLWIKLIAILPQFRRKGIGGASVDLLYDRCRIIYGTSNVLLSVVGKNEEGVRFWLKQGFAETGRFTKMLFGDPSPYEVIIMNKKL